MKQLIVLVALFAVVLCDQNSCEYCKRVGKDLFQKFNNDFSSVTDDQLLSALLDECKQLSLPMVVALCESMSKSLCPMLAEHARAGESVETICKEFKLC